MARVYAALRPEGIFVDSGSFKGVEAVKRLAEDTGFIPRTIRELPNPDEGYAFKAMHVGVVLEKRG